MNTLVECGVKMSKNDEGKMINSTTFKSLVGSLRYLTCTHPHILFRVWLVSRLLERPIITHFKTLKRILWYIKVTIDFGLIFWYSNSFELVGYIYCYPFFGIPTKKKRKYKKIKKLLSGENQKIYVSEKRMSEHLENNQRLVKENKKYKD